MNINWISVIPDSGYGNDSVVVKYDANVDSLSRSESLFLVGNDLSIKFLFKQEALPVCAINIFTDPLEAGTVSGNGKYLSGTNIKITAIPSKGWEFKDWEEDSLIISNDSVYNFITSCSRTLKAKFKKLVNIVEDGNEKPQNFKLYQNYPNPFNPSTKIKYGIPNSSFVKLKVYDILGNEIVTLVNKYQSAGYYEVNFFAPNLPSGIYIYRLESENFISTKKLLLLK